MPSRAVMGDQGPGSSAPPAPTTVTMHTPDPVQNGSEAVDHRGENLHPFYASSGTSNRHPCERHQLRPGSPRCECAACGEGFNSVRAFERHQRMMANGTARCLDASEMRAKGMVWRDGWWYTTADTWCGPDSQTQD